jgi:uncharacterized membrane protein
MKLLSLPLSDAVAFVCFLLCWQGYSLFARWLGRTRPNLLSAVSAYRELWMRRVCQRQMHVADATLLSNLLRGCLFFASTTVLILGGLVAVLGTGTKVAEVVGHLPYAATSEAWLLELKALALIVLFVYAFFKFTWSAWNYNVLSILVGAAPDTGASTEEVVQFTRGAADIATMAGENYNKGIRAYYFSIPLLAWFVDPFLFLGVTLMVAFVLYRREFASPILRSLRREGAP